MKRSGPPQRKTPMPRSKPLSLSSALSRKGPLKAASAKRRKQEPKRAALRKQMLADNPLCERCGCAPATDLHERLRRSQGGDILDAAGISLLCRPCHVLVTERPQQGHDEGWVVWSWEAKRGRGAA